jgi:hypothetical protein
MHIEGMTEMNERRKRSIKRRINRNCYEKRSREEEEQERNAADKENQL